MRWGTKQIPSHGQPRIVTKFLIFPKCIGAEWRWLETTTWIEIWHAAQNIYDISEWQATRWGSV